jgi:hypothetical protein
MSDVEYSSLDRRDKDILRLLSSKVHIGVDSLSNDMKR